jgi:hypothetical protein
LSRLQGAIRISIMLTFRHRWNFNFLEEADPSGRGDSGLVVFRKSECPKAAQKCRWVFFSS